MNFWLDSREVRYRYSVLSLVIINFISINMLYNMSKTFPSASAVCRPACKRSWQTCWILSHVSIQIKAGLCLSLIRPVIKVYCHCFHQPSCPEVNIMIYITLIHLNMWFKGSLTTSNRILFFLSILSFMYVLITKISVNLITVAAWEVNSVFAHHG